MCVYRLQNLIIVCLGVNFFGFFLFEVAPLKFVSLYLLSNSGNFQPLLL